MFIFNWVSILTLPFQYASQEKHFSLWSEGNKRPWRLPQELFASSPRHGWYIWTSLNGPKWDPGVRASSYHLAPLWSGLWVSVQTQPAASLPLIGWMLSKPRNSSQSETFLINYPKPPQSLCFSLNWSHCCILCLFLCSTKTDNMVSVFAMELFAPLQRPYKAI